MLINTFGNINSPYTYKMWVEVIRRVAEHERALYGNEFE